MNQGQGQQPQRIGKGMIYAGAIMALALLTWFFDGVLDRQNNPNQHPASKSTANFNEVTLIANRQDQYVVTAKLNGQPVDVLVDTGASDVAVSQAFADKLNLPRGQRMVASTANGIIEGYQTRLEEVTVGAITLRDVAASVIPNMSSPDVLLGMTFLRDLEMIQRDGMLILRQN